MPLPPHHSAGPRPKSRGRSGRRASLGGPAAAAGRGFSSWPASAKIACFSAFLLVALFARAATPGQIRPDAPVLNFRLPMFSDEGHLVWDLRGSEGVYTGGEQVDVKRMRLQVFDEEQAGRVELEFHSPTATVGIREQIAGGDDTITMIGDNVLVEGERWQWFGKEKRVVIDENVKVTFFEELSGILP